MFIRKLNSYFGSLSALCLLRGIMVLALVTALISPLAYGQGLSTLRGTVKDPSGPSCRTQRLL